MKINDTNYVKIAEQLNSIFLQEFKEALNVAIPTDLNGLLKYTSAFYRQWYYSAMINDTIVSPANILNSMISSDDFDETSDKTEFYAPAVKMKSKVARNGFVVNLLKYTIDDHPIYDDIIKLTKLFSPDLSLTERSYLKTVSINKILPQLSISDPFYVEYLFHLCLSLNIIKKIPSLYSNKAYISQPDMDKFLQASPKDKFDEIINASLHITNKNMASNISTSKDFFNKSFLTKLLKQPHSTDDLFKEFCSCMGIDVENLWSTENLWNMQMPHYNLTDFEENLIASTFILGVLLDRYFFSIYGYFLKLIDPIYIFTYDFDDTLLFIQDTSHDALIGTLHAPCTTYSITPLGMEYFNTSLDPKENNRIIIKNPISDFVNMISNGDTFSLYDNFDSYDNYSHASKFNQDDSSMVYLLKIKLKNNTKLWKNVEILGNLPLCLLHLFIADIFNLEAGEHHEFYMSSVENPFSKYVSPTTMKTKNVKTTDVFLSQFDLEKGSKFIYVALETFDPFSDYSSKALADNVKFEITVMDIKESDFYEFYPKVQRTSTELKRLTDFI